jgi:hypothetical protein
MRSILAPLLLLPVVALVALGCPSSETCLEEVAACPDAGNGSCVGQCIETTQANDFILLWSGPDGATAPACPTWTPGGVFPGFLDEVPPEIKCSACTCSSSFGSCGPSSSFANSATCPATTGQQFPFEAPATWDGSCTSMDPVASAASVTVNMPMVLSGDGCNVGTSTVEAFKGGKTIALVCQIGMLGGACPSLSEGCGPPSVPGFEVCALYTGPCPANLPVPHTFYAPSTACACSCGPATGDSCSETVTAYSDGACSEPIGSGTLTTADAMTCFDVSAGPLGSKKASFSYTPGTCQSTLTKITPQTFCCLN